MFKLLRRAAIIPNRTVLKCTLFNKKPMPKHDCDAAIQLKDVFKLCGLTDGPITKVTLTKENALQYYKQMRTIRQMDSAPITKEKGVSGFCQLYTGQEAVVVGMKASMRNQDKLITAYRSHGWRYVLGITAPDIVEELKNSMFKCNDSLNDFGKNLFGGSGVVGAQIALGTGVALACKYQNNGGVCLACYGNIAANQSQLFESYNLACRWQLPVVFICESNSTEKMDKTKFKHTSNYNENAVNIPVVWVDGMNVLAVRSATKFAIDFALKHGPIIMELQTARCMEKLISELPVIESSSNKIVQQLQKLRDPIQMFRELCILHRILTADELKTIDDMVKPVTLDGNKIVGVGKESILNILSEAATAAVSY